MLPFHSLYGMAGNGVVDMSACAIAFRPRGWEQHDDVVSEDAHWAGGQQLRDGSMIRRRVEVPNDNNLAPEGGGVFLYTAQKFDLFLACVRRVDVGDDDRPVSASVVASEVLNSGVRCRFPNRLNGPFAAHEVGAARGAVAGALMCPKNARKVQFASVSKDPRGHVGSNP